MFTRVCSEEQIATTASLATTIWSEHYTSIIGSEQVEYMLHNFQSVKVIREQIEDPNISYYLIESGSDTVGYCSVHKEDSHLFISKLYLVQSARRQGLGRKTIRFIEQLARDLGLESLKLTVNRHNLVAIKAYKKLGFNNDGTQIKDIGNGFVMDDYCYVKHVFHLPILFQDEHFIAVNKPSGLLVHRSMIDKYETDFAMQIVRDQIGAYVYPVHRLDKPTSGVLLFALNKESARAIGASFEANQVKKKYLAVVRGYIEPEGVIDYPLKEVHDKMTDSKADPHKEAQHAITGYKRLGTVELPYPVSRYPQARYSLVRLYPHTGRKHQLRRHMKHIQHPIVGDTKYGRTEHNNLYREKFNINRLLLHSDELVFDHPFTGETITINAPLEPSLTALFKEFGWQC